MLSWSTRIRIALAWTGLVAFFAYFLRTYDPGTPFALSLIAALLVSTAVVGFLRGRRTLARIQELIALGDPEPLLALVRRKLRYARSGPNRGPLRVFEAVGLSMKGEWAAALEVLGQVDAAALPDRGRAVWEFGYHAARFSCLVFTECLDEARAVLRDHIERLAATPELPPAGDAVQACRAMMWFCDGDHDRAMSVFAALVRDTRIPPSSRAVFHYFIGRIYHAGGKWNASEQHFAEAARLGPKTWVPAGIAAFIESKKLRA